MTFYNIPNLPIFRMAKIRVMLCWELISRKNNKEQNSQLFCWHFVLKHCIISRVHPQKSTIIFPSQIRAESAELPQYLQSLVPHLFCWLVSRFKIYNIINFHSNRNPNTAKCLMPLSSSVIKQRSHYMKGGQDHWPGLNSGHRFCGRTLFLIRIFLSRITPTIPDFGNQLGEIGPHFYTCWNFATSHSTLLQHTNEN